MRVAVYYVPDPASPLWRFGTAALGYDSVTGSVCPQLAIDGVEAEDVRQATAAPRRYGFHGTLKPPFALAEGQEIAALLRALEDFAARQVAFDVASMRVASLGRFVALVPTAPSEGLAALAADCVETFEPFRAPLTDSDRQRRLAKPLSERQTVYLDRWGYPYVFDEFRFHMTLTGPLDDPVRERFKTALAEHYSAIEKPLRVDAVALCQQSTRTEPFRVVRRFPFGG